MVQIIIGAPINDVIVFKGSKFPDNRIIKSADKPNNAPNTMATGNIN